MTGDLTTSSVGIGAADEPKDSQMTDVSQAEGGVAAVRRGFEVMSRKCAQCLFTPQRIVSAARMKEIVRDCRRRDVSFVCHKSPAGREIACRGHFDTGVGQMSRISERLGMIVEIDPAAQASATSPRGLE